jgi:hypothetical protein
MNRKSKCPSIANWSPKTCSRIAHRLFLLAKRHPDLYRHFKEWEAYYLSRGLNPESELTLPAWNQKHELN